MYHGVINVYKEPGFTSHDVVAKLRGILKQKKIGHTGTLDPAACGVLPVCLGQGTRIADMLTEKKKTYEAVLLLGQETDTQDTTGEVLARCPVNVSEEEVRRTAASFIGPQKQVPPMYSALKVEGKKLYELARAGKEVERPARDIQIDELTMNWIKLPRVGMTVTCSKGTYIRTLCYDLGKALGCGGCMEKLTRTRVERFLIQDSLTLSQIETLRDENRVEEIILPIEAMFDGPRAIANEAGNKKLINGNPVAAEDFAFILREDGQAEPLAPEALPKTGLVRVYSADRKFLGLYEYEERRRFWKPKKMFPT
ncbi:MAG: tRNA pseudouridine(55) synthase TruB [Lachnospiraceae bacterium]|nr:tRNA pseudouridine(55) synthase TruB [Lachnospiraceae bacterium]